MFVKIIINQIIHGVGEELVETALFPKYVVEHPPIAEQLVLPTGAGIELVVHVLEGAGYNATDSWIEIRISFVTSQAGQFSVKPLDFLGQGFRRHVNDHLLEGLVVVEWQNGDLLQGDGVAPQHNEQGVADHGRIHWNQPPTIAKATHPEGIRRLGGNQEDSFEVGDGATMRQLADHVSVTYRYKAIRSDHLTHDRNLVLKQ